MLEQFVESAIPFKALIRRLVKAKANTAEDVQTVLLIHSVGTLAEKSNCSYPLRLLVVVPP